MEGGTGKGADMSPVANIKDIGKGSESGTPNQDHAPLRRTRTPTDLK